MGSNFVSATWGERGDVRGNPFLGKGSASAKVDVQTGLSVIVSTTGTGWYFKSIHTVTIAGNTITGTAWCFKKVLTPLLLLALLLL